MKSYTRLNYALKLFVEPRRWSVDDNFDLLV